MLCPQNIIVLLWASLCSYRRRLCHPAISFMLAFLRKTIEETLTISVKHYAFYMLWWSEFFRERKQWYAYIYKKRYCIKNWHVIMEADKSLDLQSASWRLRRANGIALVLVQRPATKEIWWHCSGLKACTLKTQRQLRFQFEADDRKTVISQLKGYQAGEISSYLPKRQSFLLYSDLQLIGWTHRL